LTRIYYKWKAKNTLPH